jgi:hypothetical protein
LSSTKYPDPKKPCSQGYNMKVCKRCCTNAVITSSNITQISCSSNKLTSRIASGCTVETADRCSCLKRDRAWEGAASGHESYLGPLVIIRVDLLRDSSNYNGTPQPPVPVTSPHCPQLRPRERPRAEGMRRHLPLLQLQRNFRSSDIRLKLSLSSQFRQEYLLPLRSSRMR